MIYYEQTTKQQQVVKIKMSEFDASEIETKEDDSSPKEESFSHPVYKQLSIINGKISRYGRAELIRNLKIHGLDTEGTNKVLSKRLKNFYRRTMLNVHGIHEKNKGKVSVHFDYYLVIDFEATCQRQHNSADFQPEIIEFPAVLLKTQKLEITDEFKSYCRPVINPLLTEFCTELTGITQEDVDKAPLFHEVLSSFEEWLDKNKLGTKYSYAIVTDGPWDLGKFLKDQCMLSKVDFPDYCNYWINIRKTFSNYYDCGKLPLSSMIQLIGQEFQGRAHSGIDDARNITSIVQRLLRDGAKVVFNEKLAVKGQGQKRPDGSTSFSSPVHNAEFKSLQGTLRPNYPIAKKKPDKI